MSGGKEGHEGLIDELPDDGAIDWTIIRSLLSASDSTSSALESHLMQTYYYGGDTISTAATQQYLDAAISKHERILEDLRLARDALDERN
ncbi:hypothetical protein [Haloferax larsenii]|uniref:DUF8103 domain-containing protein n=1 Tax=Haloferax larsenii TaxID=302484 RepID=A0A1H7UYX3_HALLR|nr:hypothetical protein [Haloferax larsenii]SEM01979.1 hypothetical protein SAMN04488691_11527 [Haloferax larsenii]